MGDRITDSIALQDVGRKFCRKHNFKVMEMFSLGSFMSLLIMGRSFNKYCSSFSYQKAANFIFSAWLYLENSCFGECYVLKNSTKFGNADWILRFTYLCNVDKDLLSVNFTNVYRDYCIRQLDLRHSLNAFRWDTRLSLELRIICLYILSEG